MFCKWCGGSLAPSDLKCRRCGKEVPARSDCGGFYDLISDAQQRLKPPKDGDPHPERSSGSNADSEDRNGKTNKSVTKKRLPHPFFGAVVALVIAGIILPWKTNQCAADRRALRDELNSIISDADAVEARLQALEEAEADERIESVPELVPNPAPEPDEPVFSKQDVSFSFKIVEQQDARAYLPAYDFGQCDDKSTISVVLGDETASAVYLTERAGQIELGFSCRSDGGLRTATVTYRIDETVFGLPGVPEICNWAYRVGSKDSWHLITEDIFSQTGASGLSALSIPETGWQNLIGDSEETIELRCEVYRANILKSFPQKLEDVATILEAGDNAAASQFK